jgi:hypothetical protein
MCSPWVQNSSYSPPPEGEPEPADDELEGDDDAPEDDEPVVAGLAEPATSSLQPTSRRPEASRAGTRTRDGRRTASR